MDRIWSPWRAEHIESVGKDDPETDSIFVKMASQHRDEENLIVWRGRNAFVVMNRYPYNNGHLLIVPYRQVVSYTDLTPDEQMEVASIVDSCIRWLDEAFSPEGFNVGMNIGTAGGAGIPKHLHIHVVPRWSADTNFMTSTASAKVIPESLQETYNKLRRVLNNPEKKAAIPSSDQGAL